MSTIDDEQQHIFKQVSTLRLFTLLEDKGLNVKTSDIKLYLTVEALD